MTIDEILDIIRQGLARDALDRREETPAFNPAAYDQHVAASVLQKSVRRGEETFALRAAARLLETDPIRLWRRLLVITFEDVGIGNLDIVGRVTAVSGQKRWRSAHGGEWPIVGLLVTDLCRAIKDRTSDDLIHLASYDPALRDHRRCWGTASIDRLTDFIDDRSLGLPEKALAVWLGVGTDKYQSRELRTRRGFPEQVYATFKAMGVPDDVLSISWTAHRKMSWPLAALLPLIWHEEQGAIRRDEPDDMTSLMMVGDAPSFALDGFTRSGKAAIRGLLGTSIPLRRFLSAHAAEKAWPKMVAEMLFRIEGGLMSPRLRWREGDKIKQAADVIVPGLLSEVVPEGLEILKSELPALDTIRMRIGVPTFR